MPAGRSWCASPGGRRRRAAARRRARRPANGRPSRWRWRCRWRSAICRCSDSRHRPPAPWSARRAVPRRRSPSARRTPRRRPWDRESPRSASSRSDCARHQPVLPSAAAIVSITRLKVTMSAAPPPSVTGSSIRRMPASSIAAITSSAIRRSRSVRSAPASTTGARSRARATQSLAVLCVHLRHRLLPPLAFWRRCLPSTNIRAGDERKGPMRIITAGCLTLIAFIGGLW